MVTVRSLPDPARTGRAPARRRARSASPPLSRRRGRRGIGVPRGPSQLGACARRCQPLVEGEGVGDRAHPLPGLLQGDRDGLSVEAHRPAHGQGRVLGRQVDAADTGVDRARPRPERGDVEFGGVVDVDQRPVVATVADAGDGPVPLARGGVELVDQTVLAPVEQARPDHDGAAAPLRPPQDRLLHGPAPGDDGGRVPRRRLVDDAVGVAVDPGAARVDVRAGADPVLHGRGGGEVRLTTVGLRQVHHGLGPRGGRVEHAQVTEVAPHRSRPRRGHHPGRALAARHRLHHVPVADQGGDRRPADIAGTARNEYLHRSCTSSVWNFVVLPHCAPPPHAVQDLSRRL